MPKYKVLLRGENFLLQFDGVLGAYGFFTTRFLEAQDPDAAELAAVQLIRNDETLRGAVENEAGNPPRIFLDSIAEVSSFESARAGYTFFPEEVKDEENGTV